MAVIKFEGIRNVRDLTGIPCDGGRIIVPGRLIRGSALNNATPADAAKLINEYHLGTIADLRTDDEVKTKVTPYALFEGVNIERIKVLEWASLGVSRDEATQEQREAFLAHPEIAMQGHYNTMVLGDAGKAAFKRFFDILLEEAPTNHAIYWHCMGGKDRTGVVAMLLLYVMGASWDDIFADYLLTNNDRLPDGGKAAILRSYKGDEELADALVSVNSADVAYLQGTLKTINEAYGSLDAYLEQAVGLDEQKIEALRDAYLM